MFPSCRNDAQFYREFPTWFQLFLLYFYYGHFDYVLVSN